METPLFGNYRAKVIDNIDPDTQGRVKVWIPDIMPDVEDTKGLWARPANNPVGGRNSEEEGEAHHFQGSCYIPKKGSWVWIFFEAGNVNRPYYFAALDIENPPDSPSVVAECQYGNYERKWVVFKSTEGRCIVISDDPSDERVEITGKKREMSNPPHGDGTSVYKIDDNQTVILLDEQEGREKLLIRTRLGDYIHVDIEEQKLQAYFKEGIHLQTDGDFHLKVGKSASVNIGEDLFLETMRAMHRKAGTNIHETSGGEHHTKAGSTLNRDAPQIQDNAGASVDASPASPIVPDGERDT